MSAFVLEKYAMSQVNKGTVHYYLIVHGAKRIRFAYSKAYYSILKAVMLNQ